MIKERSTPAILQPYSHFSFFIFRLLAARRPHPHPAAPGAAFP